MSFRIGICVPMAVTREDISVSMFMSMEGKKSSWKDIKNGVDNEAISEAASLEELDSDDTKNVFFDRVKACGIFSCKVATFEKQTRTRHGTGTRRGRTRIENTNQIVYLGNMII